MALQSKDIRCTGGECYAYVFENSRTGLKRGLFWNFILECAPIRSGGEELITSVLCDWVTLPTRDWRAMSKVRLEDMPRKDLLESSFYLGFHLDVEIKKFEIALDREDYFRVHAVGHFDLNGFEELDGSAIPFEIAGSIQFKELTITADNLFPKPNGLAEAKAVVREFIDLDGFEEPTRDESRYLFRPKVKCL